MGGIVAFGSALGSAEYTAARGVKLDNLDALMSSRLGSVFCQTGYAHTFGGSGSGEDAKYEDVTIAAVSLITSCIVHLQPLQGDGAPVPAGYSARLTSTTNLRIAVNPSTSAVGVRWYVTEVKP